MPEKIDLDEERIYGVPKKINTDLNNISKNIGITKAQLIRKKFREILNGYADNIKSQSHSDQQKTDITVKGISPKSKSELLNIASHVGIDPSSLMKIFLKQIADEFPDHMKRPYID